MPDQARPVLRGRPMGDSQLPLSFRLRRWFEPGWVIPLVYIAGSVVVFFLVPELGRFLMWGSIVAFAFMMWRLGETTAKVDVTLRRAAPNHLIFRYHRTQVPGYRFPDYYRALQAYCSAGLLLELRSAHMEDLPDILAGRFYDKSGRRLNSSTHTTWPIGPDETESFPSDCFWAVSSAEANGNAFAAPHILRLRYEPSMDVAVLELGLPARQPAEELLEYFDEWTRQHSIYRHQALSITFDAEVRDEYGTLSNSEKLNIEFVRLKPVGDGEIVIAPETEAILKRNVYDLFDHRDVLVRHGIPLNRGVLFYGPPGTGKTYTCRHIFARLKEVTFLVATGQALLHVKSICHMARMLQPAVVLLEDVDLVFQSREINLYSSALGDLLDQLDGFKANDSVVFLMTTNAIERLEKAIKDRPGRISQCILFEPPNAELRARYLAFHLQGRDYAGLDLDSVAAKVPGVTQAFIKEWCIRAVQFAVEANADQPHLREEHFDAALAEIVRHDNEAAFNILGYRQAVL